MKLACVMSHQLDLSVTKLCSKFEKKKKKQVYDGDRLLFSSSIRISLY